MKFLLEISKLQYGCVLGVPVRLGNGLIVFSVGIEKSRCDVMTKRGIILDVLQLAMAMIGGLREVDHLFHTQKLSTLEAKALMFAMQGFSNNQIASFLKLGEVTVDMLFKSAADRMNATNSFQLISKAIADGEIANIQLTDSQSI
jgi:DNA-binding CsgD family transcriptional regulator